MRALTEEETRMVFEKLHKFIGKAIKSLVSSEREDVAYCLRLQKGRVYYVREDLMRRATNVARDKLVGLGVCIGKFTHGGKFRLTVGSLDVLAKHAKYKVCRFCFPTGWGVGQKEQEGGWSSHSDDVKNFFSLQTERGSPHEESKN
jgi:ribosome biogenesis protein Nip4